jgi:hypothetical protein
LRNITLINLFYEDSQEEPKSGGIPVYTDFDDSHDQALVHWTSQRELSGNHVVFQMPSDPQEDTDSVHETGNDLPKLRILFLDDKFQLYLAQVLDMALGHNDMEVSENVDNSSSANVSDN